jgi:hypothetical protein
VRFAELRVRGAVLPVTEKKGLRRGLEGWSGEVEAAA